MHPTDVKHLKKVLSAVDDRIELPESLRGSALLHKLEGIQPDTPTKRKVWEFVLPRQPRVRAWVASAAAFALVVGLLYSLGLNRPAELALGEIEIGGQSAELAALEQGGGISPINGHQANGVADQMGTRLGEFREFVLYYRPNDASNHIEAPYLLLLLDADRQAIISQVEIPHITNIISFSSQGNTLTLLGTCGDSNTHTYSIDFTDTENPIITLL